MIWSLFFDYFFKNARMEVVLGYDQQKENKTTTYECGIIICWHNTNKEWLANKKDTLL